MKYYNQNDLILVFGIIVIGYFALRYLMTRKLIEGQDYTKADSVNLWDTDEECQSDFCKTTRPSFDYTAIQRLTPLANVRASEE